MTQQYDNTNKGALFINDRKASDKHPDMNGKLNVNGVDHWISGWWKQTANGEILSLSLGQPVEQKQAPSPRRGRPQPAQPNTLHTEDIDDDIPV